MTREYEGLESVVSRTVGEMEARWKGAERVSTRLGVLAVCSHCVVGELICHRDASLLRPQSSEVLFCH